MRHIPTDSLELPDDWNVNVAAALTAVQNLASGTRRDRNNEMDTHAVKTWRMLKDALAALSSEKCWYCEIRQDRSLGEVDHFRPKGKVLGVPSHPGYWWLAFDVTNYRYTCSLCNRRTTDRRTGRIGGKHDQFPIYDESRRATCQVEDWRLEEPMLLDPLIPTDPGLMTWQVNGDAAPRYTATQNRKWHDRADLSILVYHLNHYKLRLRRRKIYNHLKLLVQEGDILYAKAASGQVFQQASLDRVTQEIIQMIAEGAELSAAATQYLLEFRAADSNRTWLDSVIIAA